MTENHPLPHDLLEADDARAALKMPQAKFELLVSSGQLPIFRSNGRPCFRREDVVALAQKRQAAQSLASKPRTAKPAEAAKPAAKERDKYAATRQALAKSATGESEASSQSVESSESADDLAPVSSRQSTWKKRVVLWGGVACVLAVIALITFGPLKPHDDVPVVPQNAGTNSGLSTFAGFARCKAAPGLVEADSGERNLSFQIGGKLRAVFVDEGKLVKAGDRIAELENTDLLARVRSSQADVNAAEARLGAMKVDLETELQKAASEVSRLKAELSLLEPRQEDKDQATAEASAADFDAKLAADEEYRYRDPSGEYKSWAKQLHDQALRKSQAAQAKFEAASAHVRALNNGSRPEEKERMKAMLASAEAEVARRNGTNALQLKSAEAQVEQARAQLELANAELEKTRIFSPVNGTVVRKYMYPGEVIDVLHPQPVVTLADLTQLRVRADVDEADYTQIHPGQRVKIAVESADDAKSYTGTVESISPRTGQKRFSTGEAKERMDVKIIETVIKFDTPPPPNAVKLGLRVTAYFELEK